MTRRSPFPFLAVMLLSLTVLPSSPHADSAPGQAATFVAKVPDSCHVTKPPAHAFVPPKPYASSIVRDAFWFGNEKLWTFLPASGTWNGLPHYTPDDPTFRQKLFFWHRGFNARAEPQPPLILIGKRLDGPAPPLASDRANAGWQREESPFIVTGINIPTLGCWQITAQYHAAKLTFVVWVTQ